MISIPVQILASAAQTQPAQDVEKQLQGYGRLYGDINKADFILVDDSRWSQSGFGDSSKEKTELILCHEGGGRLATYFVPQTVFEDKCKDYMKTQGFEYETSYRSGWRYLYTRSE